MGPCHLQTGITNASLDSFEPLLFLLLVGTSSVMLMWEWALLPCITTEAMSHSRTSNCLLLVFWGCISSVQQSSWPIISSRSLALLSGWDTDLMQQARMRSVGMLPWSICFLGLIFFSIYLCVYLGCWDKVYFSPGWLHTHANLFSSLLLFLPDSTSWVYASRSVPTPQRLGFQRVILPNSPWDPFHSGVPTTMSVLSFLVSLRVFSSSKLRRLSVFFI